jgi:hypothetical protein
MQDLKYQIRIFQLKYICPSYWVRLAIFSAQGLLTSFSLSLALRQARCL